MDCLNHPACSRQVDSGLRRNDGAFTALPQGEIVVTAQKREQSLQDVSVSVTAVSGDMYYVRGQLAYDLNDDLSMLLRAEHWQDNANGNGDFGYKPLGVPVNQATGRTNGLSGVLNERVSGA